MCPKSIFSGFQCPSIVVCRPSCFVVVWIVNKLIDFPQSKRSKVKFALFFAPFSDVQWNNLRSVDAHFAENSVKSVTY